MVRLETVSNALSVALLLTAFRPLLPWLQLGLSGASAQQDAPLLGQGVDPRTAGAVNRSVEVFTTAVLVKLLEIDEKQYRFTAMVDVYLTWEDPRASRLFAIAEANLLYGNAARAHAQAACYNLTAQKKININADGWRTNVTESADCKKAFEESPECRKYCSMIGNSAPGTLCCDLLWLPNIDVPNLLQNPSDRVVFDRIERVRGLSNNLVTRVTRIYGTFRWPLRFRRYPFDKQSLLVQLVAKPPRLYLAREDEEEPYHLAPSATLRYSDMVLKTSGNRQGSFRACENDEIPGWTIGDVSLFCSNQSYVFENETSLEQNFTETDPTTLAILDVFEHGERVCAFQVDVQRMYSTEIASSILPVGFIALSAFSMFFVEPDSVDVRLSTEITLFLALTAVQFIFSDILPATSKLTNFDVFILMSYVLIIIIVLENLLVYNMVTWRDQRVKRGYDMDQELLSGAAKSKGLSNREGAQTLSNSLRNLAEKVALDQQFAYRLALYVDAGTGITLFVSYVVLAMLIFTGVAR